MEIDITDFSVFLTCLWEAGHRDEFKEHLRNIEVNGDTVQLTHTNTYNVFGHIKDSSQLVATLKKYPLSLSLDGSEPIYLAKSFSNFPHYDSTISPILQQIINRFYDLLPTASSWECTLDINEIEEGFYQCYLTGTVVSEYNATSGTGVSTGGLRSKDISSVAMASDIPSVLHSIRLSLPRLLQ